MSDEDEFFGGIWWVPAKKGGLRNAKPSECAAEIRRLRTDLAAALGPLIDAFDAVTLPSEAQISFARQVLVKTKLDGEQ